MRPCRQLCDIGPSPACLGTLGCKAARSGQAQRDFDCQISKNFPKCMTYRYPGLIHCSRSEPRKPIEPTPSAPTINGRWTAGPDQQVAGSHRRHWSYCDHGPVDAHDTLLSCTHGAAGPQRPCCGRSVRGLTLGERVVDGRHRAAKERPRTT